ncbi:MAG: serine/threonine protein kinase [Acidobacteria bacterium]|nr:serine/threonine protein kinase [Acidobacteriota bacterium]
MTPTRWRKVEDIFHAALELPAADRERFITQSCSGDVDMESMVREMIDADEESSSNLGRIDVAVQHAAKIAIHGSRSDVPKRLGPYQIEREIGSGGMGTVYLATRADDQYQKQVAVKLIHRGMTFAGSVERFLQERQILANLDHPYIARLLDGGTAPDGRPYLILDYVEGVTIDAYCREHKMSIQERCRLFLKVCDAVAYAHQNLIVHRDLKPANILVNAEAVPKLLDFGIAKLLGEGATEAMTRTAVGMMTPEYASPEQVRGQPVSTSVDVYALGAILFELLAGKPAHKFSNYSATELVRIICEEEVPTIASVAMERIPGDLEKIVHKAMAKEPRERYQSAEQLADDIRRHLDRLPVLARGNSATYRARKFLARNWIPVTAVTLTIASLAVGVILALRQAEIAERMRQQAEAERSRALRAMQEATEQRAVAQRNASEALAQKGRADERFHQVRTLIQRFLFDIDRAVEDVPGTSAARRVVAKTALEYLDSMTKDGLPDRSILRDLAVAYERVAELQGSPVRPSLNDFPAALASYQKAVRIRRELGIDSPVVRAERIMLLANLGMLFKNMDRRPESASAFDEGLRLFTGPDTAHVDVKIAAANLYNQRAELRYTQSLSQECIDDYRRSEQLLSQVSAGQPENIQVARSLGLVRMHLGEHLCRASNYPDGLRYLRQSVDQLRELTRREPNNMAHVRSLGLALRSLSSAYLDRAAGEHRNTDEALRLAGEQVEVSKRVAEQDTGNHTAQRDYIRAVAALARAHAARDEWEPSSRIFGQALAMTEASPHASDASSQLDIAYYGAEIATAEYSLKNYQKAMDMGRRSVAIWEASIARGSKNRFHYFNIALVVRRFGDIARVNGDRELARREYQRAMDIFTSLQKQDPATQMFALQVKMTEEAMAKLK